LPCAPVRRRSSAFLIAFAVACAAFAVGGGSAGANQNARVFLNGVPVQVWFNDGDTFRVLEGEYRNTPCRLNGFNTLESYGPGHQWGDWHPYELYIIAKMATMNGRRGSWHCTTSGERDGYGRALTECPDLAIDQIRRGYAHALQVDDTTSRPEYLRAQHEAMAARRGMWAHGVPDFLMTSLHSADEDSSREWHYNRLVSTEDGHSESWQHRERYSECQWVCNTEHRADMPRVRAVARSIREDATLGPMVASMSNIVLTQAVSRFARRGELPGSVEDPLRTALLARMETERPNLGTTTEAPGACMLYAEFQRRYGPNRAECLRGHGTVPPTYRGAH
jgi:endonuclease YncB( thermonuclease family)